MIRAAGSNPPARILQAIAHQTSPGGGKVIKVNPCCEDSVMTAYVISCALAYGMAHAAGRAATDRDAAVGHTVRLVTAATTGAAIRRPPLDLRPPALRRVTAHSVLLTEIGANPQEEDQSVKIVAEPALVPMRSNAQAHLGLTASLQWSVEHPTQA
jgi:hypothetical protein